MTEERDFRKEWENNEHINLFNEISSDERVVNMNFINDILNEIDRLRYDNEWLIKKVNQLEGEIDGYIRDVAIKQQEIELLKMKEKEGDE
jgi:hypothetical protein